VGADVCECTFPCDGCKGDKGCEDSIQIPPIRELLDDDGNKERADCIQTVRDARKEEHACLVLGAGVSISANMPDWNGLLSRLAGYALWYRGQMNEPKGDPIAEAKEQAKRALLRSLEQDLILGDLTVSVASNPLEAAQYIWKTMDIRSEMDHEGTLQAMISAIIEDTTTAKEFCEKHPDWKPAGEDTRDEDARDREARDLAKGNTLCAVAYALQAKGGFRRALTYNYDTLVQEYLIDVFNIPPERIITHADQWTCRPSSASDPIEIFHVHGCLPRPEQRGKGTAFPQPSKRLILTEESYRMMESWEVYNWCNSVQSYFLNRDSCVFVGFSAEDYNFRRILHQLGGQQQERQKQGDSHPSHYLILTVESLVKNAYSHLCRARLGGSLTPADLEKEVLALFREELRMKADYWKYYGFHPIWATRDDIPETLLELMD